MRALVEIVDFSSQFSGRVAAKRQLPNQTKIGYPFNHATLRKIGIIPKETAYSERPDTKRSVGSFWIHDFSVYIEPRVG